MDETQQQEHWNRWLKPYWQNRLDGVPKPLEPDEIKRMMDWLPHLTGVFPEAVDLAIQMPQSEWKRVELGNLRPREKRATRDAPRSDGKVGASYKAIPLQSPLPPDLKTKLQELDAKLTY